MLGACVLTGVALATYANSFSAPFVFDDLPSIQDNPTIRRLGTALFPSHAEQIGLRGLPVSGRPLVNFSLALNYATGGLKVAGYHKVNLLIHLLAGLTLYGIVRRTLLKPILQPRFGGAAGFLALASALLWTVHPLQTEAVTYVVQRAESLMGLFYLLTLYGFIRSTEPGASRLWSYLAIGACTLGVASKEVMVSAPLMVLLYDRTFNSGSFREAWRRHRGLLMGLAATWLLLGWLVAGTEGRGGTAGFGTNVTWLAYGVTQFVAVARYVFLTLWPHALTFDYGTYLEPRLAVIVPCALGVGLLFAGTVMALRRWPAAGFLGAWFFVILAPTSSVVPVATQTVAEHRMYLPVAGILVGLVLGAHHVLGRWNRVVLATAVAALVMLSARRNEDYASGIVLWHSAAVSRPENARAFYNLGVAQYTAGESVAARASYEEALRLKPDYAEVHYNLANALLTAGQSAQAVPHYEATLSAFPDYAKARHNLANALANSGREAEALGHYERTAQLEPNVAAVGCDWANALMRLGRPADAIPRYVEALRLQPVFAIARNNLGSALAETGRSADAIAQYQEALREDPGYADAHGNLAKLLVRDGRLAEAGEHYGAAVQLQPGQADLHNDFGMVLAALGNFARAREHFETALGINPSLRSAGDNLRRLQLLAR